MTKGQKPEIRKVKEFVRCELAEAELLECSKESARAYASKGRIEADLEGIKKRFKADAEKQENIIKNKSELINCGYEYRNMDCTLTFDWARDIKTLTRVDTGEILKELPIEVHERQKEIKAVK